MRNPQGPVCVKWKECAHFVIFWNQEAFLPSKLLVRMLAPIDFLDFLTGGME